MRPSVGAAARELSDFDVFDLIVNDETFETEKRIEWLVRAMDAHRVRYPEKGRAEFTYATPAARAFAADVAIRMLNDFLLSMMTDLDDDPDHWYQVALSIRSFINYKDHVEGV